MKLPDLLSIFKKKKMEGGERAGKEEKVPVEEEEKVETPFYISEVPKYKKRPNLIFIGSGKGGVGKSLLASNMVVVVSALSQNSVYAVDLDLDNFTLSKALQPAGFMEKLLSRIGATEESEFCNLASVLHSGAIPSIIPRVRTTTFGCNGGQLGVIYRLIPAYNPLRQKEQEIALRKLTPSLLLSGVRVLVNHFRERVAKDKNTVVIFDGKQKSNIGIEYEPLYRIMVDESDVFIMPVEAPGLSFSEITAPYKNLLDKLVIVVNRAEPAIRDRIQALVKDAVDRGIPVFLIPNVPADGDLFRNLYTPPALKSLTRPTALHTMVIAYFLNLIDDNLLHMCGCSQAVYKLLKMYGDLYEAMAGKSKSGL